MAVVYGQNVFLTYSTKLRRLGDPDFNGLMTKWEDLITEGNRRGVLSGIDGFDQPMKPLKYRSGKGKRTGHRKGGVYGSTTFLGREASATRAEYLAATGPRLAPFGERSRSIANLQTGHGRTGKEWWAIGAWFNVVNAKGVFFFPFHFAANRGKARFPRYDLRPVRRQEKTKARSMLLAYIASYVKWGKAP